MRTARIEVTQEDIDDGVPEDECKCPIARAFNRATERDYCEVDGLYVLFSHFGTASTKLPIEAIKFIRRFDGGSPVSPFAFDLVLP